MKWLLKMLGSSVGKKNLMALTGLYLSLFLVMHLAGNLLLLVNDNGSMFSEYAKSMKESKFILVNEVIMFISFIVHIVTGIVLTVQNKKARGRSYYKNSPGQNSSFASRYMALTGLLTLIFLVLHLNSFFVPYKLLGESGDMYSSVLEKFSNEVYVSVYLVAMLVLAIHLSHGFQSAFQSLGINHKRYNGLIKCAGFFLSKLVPLGFAVIPVVLYLRQM